MCTGVNFRSFKLFEGPIEAFESKTLNLLKVQQGEEEEDVDIQIPRDLIKDNPSVLTKHKKTCKPFGGQ